MVVRVSERARRQMLWTAAAVTVCFAGCSNGPTKPISAPLAAKACNNYLALLTNTPGSLGGGLPQNQSWSELWATTLAEAKTSGDRRLYEALQSTSPFITGSYEQAAIVAEPNSPTNRKIRAEFSGAESKVNNVGDLCGPFDVTLPGNGN